MTYRYPWWTVAADYVRAGVGMVFTLGPVIAMELPWLAVLILGSLAALFLAFAVHTVRIHLTRVHLTDDTVRVEPFGRQLSWSHLKQLGVAYFSTRRDGRSGWMQLKLSDGKRVLRIDSRLDGFRAVVARARQAAEGANVELDPATVRNLAALESAAELPRSVR